MIHGAQDPASRSVKKFPMENIVVSARHNFQKFVYILPPAFNGRREKITHLRRPYQVQVPVEGVT